MDPQLLEVGSISTASSGPPQLLEVGSITSTSTAPTSTASSGPQLLEVGSTRGRSRISYLYIELLKAKLYILRVFSYYDRNPID